VIHATGTKLHYLTLNYATPWYYLELLIGLFIY